MSFDLRIDIDPVIICPYDSNHKVARSRIQRHLVKCEKNFPSDYKVQCPYDATHRVFEHELSDHVSSCQMKPLVSFKVSENVGIMPEIEPPMNSHLKNSKNEVWDNVSADISTIEPAFEAIQCSSYTSNIGLRGNALIAKKYHSKLRRPFGYSESLMLDLNEIDYQADTESVTSDTGIGRGQGFLLSSKGQNVRGIEGRDSHPVNGSNNQSIRGIRGVYRRGIRGRLLH